MKEPIRIIKNILSLLGGSMIDMVIGFLIIIMIARYLGEGGLGKYSFAFAFVSLFAMFSELGISTYIIKEIARKPGKKQELLNLRLSMEVTITASMVVVIAPLAFLVTKNDLTMFTIIFFTGIISLLDGLRYGVAVIFLGLERAEMYTASLVIERVLTLILGFVLIRHYDLYGLLVAMIIAYFTSFVTGLILTIKIFKLKIKLKFPIKQYISIAKKSLPYWFTTIFSYIFFRLDTIMLGYMKSYEVVGGYNAAYSLVLGLSFIPGAFVTTVFPVMTRYFSKRKRKLLHSLYKTVSYYMIVLGIPIAIGTTILAHRIIQFVFGESFAGAAIALRILVWSASLFFINSAMGAFLNSIDQQMKFTLSTGFSAVLNIILNFALIPKYSYIGAAVATVITFLFVLVLLAYFSNKSGYPLPLISMSVQPIIASMIMGASLYVFLDLHIIIIIALSTIIYFSALVIMRSFGKKEMNLFRQIVKEYKSRVR